MHRKIDYENAIVPMNNIKSLDKKISIACAVALLVYYVVAFCLPYSNFTGDDDYYIRSDLVLPDSEYMVYDESDFEEMGLELDDVQLAINELYALYGFEFEGSLYEHFSQYDWYDPDTSDPYVVESRFTDTDRETFLNLVNYRNKLK